jgi:hypothetical protein
MQTPKNKVIIDTNLWISFLLTNNLSIDSIIADNKITLIFSLELIEEFVEVTQRKKFRKYFTLEDVEKLLVKIRDIGTFVKVTTKVEACRDAKDNFLLALAIDAKATHLITGDNDLLVLEKYGSTKILTLKDFNKEK